MNFDLRRRYSLLLFFTATVVAASACDVSDPFVDPPVVALIVVSGDEQTGMIGTTLSQPIVVRAVDAGGRGVAAVEIDWSLESGRGELDGDPRTNAEGLASASWRLGQDPGTLWARAEAGTLTAGFTALAVTELATLTGSVLAADSGSTAGLVATYSLGGTSASPIDAAGAFSLQVPVSSLAYSILIDAEPGSSRRYLPSLLDVPSGDRVTPFTVMLVPTEWQVRGGTYDDARRAISMLDAFEPPCQDETDSNCNGYFPWYWSDIPRIWPASALPIPVAFDHVESTAPISAADSTAFWQALDRMNADLGRPTFRPATVSSLPGGTATGISVRVDSTLTGSTGYANWWWDANGDLYRATVRLRTAAAFGNSRLVAHEMLHTLGHSHTCSFPSVMGGYGCAMNDGMSVDDVAYAQVGERLRRVLEAALPRFGIAAARAGEAAVLSGSQSAFRLAPSLWQRRLDAAVAFRRPGSDGAR